MTDIERLLRDNRELNENVGAVQAVCTRQLEDLRAARRELEEERQIFAREVARLHCR